jgi:outer membrane lipoprotein SlyB
MIYNLGDFLKSNIRENHMKYIKIVGCLITALCILSTGCSKDLPPGNYDSTEVGKIKKVVPGVIISMRPVNIQGKTDAPVRQNTANNEFADANVTRTRGFEYVVKLNSGSIISVVQNEELHLKSKQHILIIYGDNTRIVPDDGGDNS